MTLPRALRPALVGVVVAGLALAGCTSEEPTPVPTTSAATSTEPTPDTTTDPAEITPPEKPTLMATNDAIGARAAAEYFLSLYGYVFQTGDLTEWDAMCDPLSEFCNSVRDRTRSDAQSGYKRRGGEATPTVVRVLEPTPTVGFYEVSGQVVQAASTTTDATGSVVDQRAAIAEIDFAVLLNMNPSGQWVVRGVSIGGTES